MEVIRIRSRNQNGRNQINVVIDVQNENVNALKREIKKAIRKWNHLLGKRFSYQVLIINQVNNQLEDQ